MPPSEEFGKWRMIAQVVAPDGDQMVCLNTEAPIGIDPVTLGLEIAENLKSRGALELLSA
jgi:hydroxymethylbilane synthase